MNKFRKAKNDEAGNNWLICWTGQDAQGNHFNVTTNQVHASELHNYSKGAEKDAELIAWLLDFYYSGRLEQPDYEEVEKLLGNKVTS